MQIGSTSSPSSLWQTLATNAAATSQVESAAAASTTSPATSTSAAPTPTSSTTVASPAPTGASAHHAHGHHHAGGAGSDSANTTDLLSALTNPTYSIGGTQAASNAGSTTSTLA